MDTILIPSDGKSGTPRFPIWYARLPNPVRHANQSGAPDLPIRYVTFPNSVRYASHPLSLPLPHKALKRFLISVPPRRTCSPLHIC